MRVEPPLAGLSSVDEIVGLLALSSQPGRSDAVVGALVRLAAVDGCDDKDALLLLLHALSGVALGLARDLADLGPDVLHLVVGELTCQIRT